LTVEAARQQIDNRGWPTSANAFRRWMRLGNGTFYETYAALIEPVTNAIEDVVALYWKVKVTRRQSALASLRAKVRDLEELLSTRTQDLLSVPEDRDLERRTRLTHESRLEELGALNRAPPVEGLRGLIRHPRDDQGSSR
jgi:hypothetical protein